MSNVAVIIDRIVFISSFLFYCLLLNHSFQTNPNSITNCFQLIFSLLQLYKLHLLNAFAILIFEQVHPQPAICGHGKVLDVKTSPEAKYLNVCKGRTNQLFCASGNVTEMQMMDDTVRQTLRSYAEGEYLSEGASIANGAL